jgi:hypothetical protein
MPRDDKQVLGGELGNKGHFLSLGETGDYY